MRYYGGVHPDWRGRGIGGRLLDWADVAAGPLHRERYPDLPLSLHGSCNRQQRFGGRAVRRAWLPPGALVPRDDAGPVRALPSVDEPAGIDIVGFAPERAADARFIRDEAFRDHWGSVGSSDEGWAHFITTPVFRPDFSLLAYSGGEPAGLVLCHEYDAPEDSDEGRDLHVALVGTLRAYRKRGIASALLVRAMAKGRDAGYATASLGVDADSLTGAVGVYEQVGFAVEHTSITQEKPLLP